MVMNIPLVYKNLRCVGNFILLLITTRFKNLIEIIEEHKDA